MKVNREAIYGTQASPFEQLGWGRCTQKKLPTAATAVTGFRQHAAWPFEDLRRKSAAGQARLYFFVYDWPANGRLVIPGLANKPLPRVPARWPRALCASPPPNNSVIDQRACCCAGQGGLGHRPRHPGRAANHQARSLCRRDPRPARRPHGLVARVPLRHVHSLGRLFRPRRHLQGRAGQGHRRVDHEHAARSPWPNTAPTPRSSTP